MTPKEHPTLLRVRAIAENKKGAHPSTQEKSQEHAENTSSSDEPWWVPKLQRDPQADTVLLR